MTGKNPIFDFENLDFKIAGGLRTILTRNFKKQVATAEEKAQSEKRSLTGRDSLDDLRFLQNLWRQGSHLGLQRLIAKFDKETTTLKPSTQSESKYCQQSLTELRTTYRRVCTMCNLKSEEFKYALYVYTQETTFGHKKYNCCRLNVDGPKTSRATNQGILISKREIETRADFAMGVPRGKGKKEKAKQMPETTPREETAYVGPR